RPYKSRPQRGRPFAPYPATVFTGHSRAGWGGRSMEAATRLVSWSPRELPMSLVHAAKTLLNRRRLRPVLGPVVSRLARGKGNGVQRIFCDDGIWAPDVERLL